MAGRTLALRYGPPWSPISETEVLGTWPNWHLTSSGVAHHRIPQASFLPPTLQSTVKDPLLAASKQDPHIWALDEVISRWETTSRSAYTPKSGSGPCAQPKAPEHEDPRRTLGIKSLAEKLRRHEGLGVPLTTKYQISETKAQYTVPQYTLDQSDPHFAESQSLELNDHHRGGPSQALIPWTRNPKLAGQPFTVNKMGVIDQLQPYLSISARDFTRKSSGYPYQKSVMCQSWPKKASRHELKSLPRMRPARARPSQPVVPYLGALSLTRESYGSSVPRFCRMERFYPVDAPWRGPHRKPLPDIYSVPKAYRTENSRYGSARAELV